MINNTDNDEEMDEAPARGEQREELMGAARSSFRQRLRRQSLVLVLRHKASVKLCFLLAVVLLVLILSFELLAYLLTTAGAVIFCLIVGILSVRFLAVLSVFPGCFEFWQRSVMLDFNRENAAKVDSNLLRLIRVLSKDVENGKTSGTQFKLTHAQFMSLADSLFLFKTVVLKTLLVYSRMSECNTLTTNQA